MDQDFVVRAATDVEVESVQRLNQELFDQQRQFDDRLLMTWALDPRHGGEYFQGRVQGDGVCLVAARGDELVGYLVGGEREHETYRTVKSMEVESMYVADDARNSGVGTALMQSFVQWSKQHDADEVFVSAYFDNVDAVRFYKRNGFKSYAHDLTMDLRTASDS